MKLTDIKNSLNEISAIGGLKQVVKGNTDRVEGIKLSKEMAQAMIDWFNSSPYGRKYPNAKKGRLNLSLGIMGHFGLDRYAKHKGAKEELKYIKTLSKAMRDNVNESPVSLNKDEMEKLHKDGEIEKDGHEIKFTKEETVNEGKYDGMLDVIEDLVSKASSFMDVGNQLKKHKVKYSFSTSMMPIYKLDKLPIAIVNKRYVDKADREVGDIAIGLMESIKESKSMKLTSMLNESFGYGELPSEKLMKMKVSAKEMLDSVNPKKKSVNEGFSTWEMRFSDMNLSGVQLSKKKVYKVKARNTVEAIKKAAKMAGVGDSWMATETHSLKKIG